MSNTHSIDIEQMVNGLPGGILKLVMDDELTIVSATDNFYKLIDYDKSEKLPESIFRIVYSADIIYYTHQVAEQLRRNDKQLLLFFRVLQKNGSLKWIMINGSMSEETYQKKGYSLPVYICMAADVSSHMLQYKKIEQEIENHRTILELSKELFFEYIIATNTLSFSSELYREIFGKESTIKNFSHKLEKSKIIYQEDLPLIINTYKSVMNGKKQVRLEFRMVTKEERTVWYVCYASIIYDENKNPYKVVGKLAAINRSDNEEDEEMLVKGKADSQTKIYPKEVAEKMIAQSMSKQDPESLSALFICEVHNYKGINEICRISENENILIVITDIFKKLFRKTDIIGNIGIGNFIIYMKDLSSEKSAYNAAEQICREINNLYVYQFNKNKVYISIGLALVKGKSDYLTESANAKAALTMANKYNDSSFEVFYKKI